MTLNRLQRCSCYQLGVDIQVHALPLCLLAECFDGEVAEQHSACILSHRGEAPRVVPPCLHEQQARQALLDNEVQL